MFSSSHEILTIRRCGDEVLEQVKACLSEQGLFVMQSFDLRSSADPQTACMCASENCFCQMRVLLVYAPDSPPATLLVDSGSGRTVLSLASNLDESSRPAWVEKLPGLLENLNKP